METITKKNILAYPELWKFDNMFVSELIRVNPHNEQLKQNLHNWLMQEWNI